MPRLAGLKICKKCNHQHGAGSCVKCAPGRRRRPSAEGLPRVRPAGPCYMESYGAHTRRTKGIALTCNGTHEKSLLVCIPCGYTSNGAQMARPKASKVKVSGGY